MTKASRFRFVLARSEPLEHLAERGDVLDGRPAPLANAEIGHALPADAHATRPTASARDEEEEEALHVRERERRRDPHARTHVEANASALELAHVLGHLEKVVTIARERYSDRAAAPIRIDDLRLFGGRIAERGLPIRGIVGVRLFPRRLVRRRVTAGVARRTRVWFGGPGRNAIAHGSN
jgi:hypothetical protein